MIKVTIYTANEKQADKYLSARNDLFQSSSRVHDYAGVGIYESGSLSRLGKPDDLASDWLFTLE